MAHTAADPTTLALQISVHLEDVTAQRAALIRLTEALAERSTYAIDHAEEQLTHIASELESAARLLRSVATYTVTGAARQGA